MRLIEYIKDKYFNIILSIFMIILVLILMLLSNVYSIIIVSIVFIMSFIFLCMFIHDYVKKRTFFNNFNKILNSLDRKYLISEMINNSGFIEGNKLLEYLYEIDKCMHEEINSYKFKMEEFRLYLDMWCHEIKTPIATSKLIIDNNSIQVTSNILEEINKIDAYVEQVLFYSRSDSVEKDYIISNVDLKNVINNVVKRNKMMLIGKKIKVKNEVNNFVNSDSKWLEFIISQIVQNSIKYSKDKNAYIEFATKKNKNNVILSIKDNGIGINEEEIEKVFDKSFTVSNGRSKYNSTGIGLYLCKKLCNKLGIDIVCDSKINEYTILSIIFPIDSVIKDIK